MSTFYIQGENFRKKNKKYTEYDVNFEFVNLLYRIYTGL
jgi:hypothetical protein